MGDHLRPSSLLSLHSIFSAFSPLSPLSLTLCLSVSLSLLHPVVISLSVRLFAHPLARSSSSRFSLPPRLNRTSHLVLHMPGRPGHQCVILKHRCEVAATSAWRWRRRRRIVPRAEAGAPGTIRVGAVAGSRLVPRVERRAHLRRGRLGIAVDSARHRLARLVTCALDEAIDRHVHGVLPAQ